MAGRYSLQRPLRSVPKRGGEIWPAQTARRARRPADQRGRRRLSRVGRRRRGRGGRSGRRDASQESLRRLSRARPQGRSRRRVRRLRGHIKLLHRVGRRVRGGLVAVPKRARRDALATWLAHVVAE